MYKGEVRGKRAAYASQGSNGALAQLTGLSNISAKATLQAFGQIHGVVHDEICRSGKYGLAPEEQGGEGLRRPQRPPYPPPKQFCGLASAALSHLY